jgi:hypothetical protein
MEQGVLYPPLPFFPPVDCLNQFILSSPTLLQTPHSAPEHRGDRWRQAFPRAVRSWSSRPSGPFSKTPLGNPTHPLLPPLPHRRCCYSALSLLPYSAAGR